MKPRVQIPSTDVNVGQASWRAYNPNAERVGTGGICCFLLLWWKHRGRKTIAGSVLPKGDFMTVREACQQAAGDRNREITSVTTSTKQREQSRGGVRPQSLTPAMCSLRVPEGPKTASPSWALGIQMCEPVGGHFSFRPPHRCPWNRLVSQSIISGLWIQLRDPDSVKTLGGGD